MENAADGLIIGFAIILLVVAISITFSSIGQAKTTADIVIQTIDKSEYYPRYSKRVNGDYIDLYDNTDPDHPDRLVMTTDREGHRLVGASEIIYTIYRYHTEAYCVIINKEDGSEIARFDMDREKANNVPWLRTTRELKKRVDCFVAGSMDSTYTMNGATLKFGGPSGTREGEYNTFFISQEPFSDYKNKRFVEEFIEVTNSGEYIREEDGSETTVTPGRKTIYAIYTLVN